MNSFLDQFTDDRYNSSRDGEGFDIKSDCELDEVGDNDITTGASERNENSAIKGPEHAVAVDESYHKRRLMRILIISVSIIILGIMIFFAVRLSNQVTLKNFIGTSIDEAKTWGLTNRITIETEYEFSLEYDEDIIISQSREPQKKMQKGAVLSFIVSKGADPEERILLPDFSEMDTDQVYEWRDENKASGVNVNLEYSDTVPSGSLIRMQFNDSSVNESNYTRQDVLLIYMSRGKETFPADITVTDFTGKTKEEAEAFVTANELEATYTEEASETVPAGMIVSQSVEPETKIAKKSQIAFVISLGRSVIVPNFNSLSMEEAATYSGLQVQVKTEYSARTEYGKVIYQSVDAGTELTGENLSVEVIYSLGKPYMDNLIGTSEKELPAYFYDFRAKGADITYSVYYVDSYEPKGQIVAMSLYGEYLPMSSHVDIQVSKGNLSTPEN